jgi:tetratricopeptide (TPR) repeat protein
VSYQTNVAGNSNNSSPIAFCLLKLKLYDKALSFFENAVIENPGDSEIHFYTAVCCLKGRKAFLTPRSDIDKAMAYIEAAKSIDPCSIYDYFLSYIKLDFFHRKGYNVDPSYQIELDIARRKGLAEGDVQHLYEVLSTPRPAAI